MKLSEANSNHISDWANAISMFQFGGPPLENFIRDLAKQIEPLSPQALGGWAYRQTELLSETHYFRLSSEQLEFARKILKMGEHLPLGQALKESCGDQSAALLNIIIKYARPPRLHSFEQVKP